LLGQYQRVKKRLENNSISTISLVTKNVFEVYEKLTDLDVSQEEIDRIVIKSLMVLDGVNFGIASAILTLKYPHKYAVIDFRNWDILSEFDLLPKSKEGQRSFTLKEYLLYLKKIRNIGKKLKLHPQRVDWALWKYYELKKKGIQF
jgi:thermostable 8-oxoguanine DNA glycosylase